MANGTQRSAKLAGIMHTLPRRSMLRRLCEIATLAACVGPACASEPPPASAPWTGFFHPPSPKPGGSITGTQQCECRACDPSSCCGAEQTESTASAPPECNTSYTFSEKCGITVQTCTPRCYSHVWRIAKQESCSASRPLACCE